MRAAARDHVCVTRTRSKAAAALIVEATLVQRNLDDLMTALAPMFTRIEPRLQAAKYVQAVLSELPRRNG